MSRAKKSGRTCGTSDSSTSTCSSVVTSRPPYASANSRRSMLVDVERPEPATPTDRGTRPAGRRRPTSTSARLRESVTGSIPSPRPALKLSSSAHSRLMRATWSRSFCPGHLGMPVVEVLLDRAVLAAVAEEDVLGIAEEPLVATLGGGDHQFRGDLLRRVTGSRASAIDPLCSSSSFAADSFLLVSTLHVVAAHVVRRHDVRAGRCPAATLILRPLAVLDEGRLPGFGSPSRQVPRRDLRLLLDGEAAARSIVDPLSTMSPSRSHDSSASPMIVASQRGQRRRAPSPGIGLVARLAGGRRGPFVVVELRSSSWRSMIFVSDASVSLSGSVSVSGSSLARLSASRREELRRLLRRRTARRAWPTRARPGTSGCGARRRR